MKKLFYSLIALVSLSVGCTKNEEPETPNNVGGDEPQTEQTGVTEFGAILPEGSRTSLGTEPGSDGKIPVLWSAGDQISVWSDSEPERKYFNLTGGENTTKGTFTVDSRHKQGVSGSTYYAVYPGNLSEPATVTLPSVQNFYKEENFATKLSPMAAVGNDIDVEDNKTNLQFYNLCGILVIKTHKTGTDGGTLSRIVVSDENMANLWGSSQVTFDGETPTATGFSGGSNTVTLQMGDGGVAISTDKETPNVFYVVLPVGDYYLDLNFYVNGIRGTSRVAKSKKQVKITAGNICSVNANIDIVAAPPVPAVILHATTYAVGDLYPNAENPEGIVYALNGGDQVERDSTGWVIALKDCSVSDDKYTYSWGPASNIQATQNMSNGVVNTNRIISANLLNSYPAFKACVDLRKEGGLEWYLPAVNEYTTFTNVYTGYLKPKIDALGNKAQVLNVKNESGVNVGYWTSTVAVGESDGFDDAGYVIYYGTGINKTAQVSTEETVTRRVRAVAKFQSKTTKDGQPTW